MREASCDICIVGGGTGGVAAALAAARLGLRVILTEETDWIGGQFTSQAVPPDEHPWIEDFGCTSSYREFRERIRAFYQAFMPLTAEAAKTRRLNPGGGWVSRLCHEPRIGWLVLNEMLQPHLTSGLLDLRLERAPTAVDVQGDLIRSVKLLHLPSNAEEIVHAQMFLDATELGDLLPLSGAEYRSGAESRRETEELNAPECAHPEDVQGFTWVMAVALDEGSHRTIDKPESYEFWRSYQPSFWPGPHFGFLGLNPHTGEPRHLPLFSEDGFDLFRYRQVVDPANFTADLHPVTLVNWPQNDFFLKNVIDKEPSNVRSAFQEAKQLSLSLLYWLQTEAPRHDGGVGYPGLYLRPDIMGTWDGLAKAPYMRESRRIVAQAMVTEDMVSTEDNPGCDRAPAMADSVGIGSYRIDLHPSASGVGYIDTSTLPFQIPLGSLIPVRMRNLLPAAKNLGVSHIANGCYRLHPIEWNVGEASAILASHCIRSGCLPHDVSGDQSRVSDFQSLLARQGVAVRWPVLHPL